MKTKKVVVGAIAATMLSLSVCPIAPAVAAGETVQISVSTVEVEAGKDFTVNVSLADVPSTGIQTIDFAVSYDPSILTISEVKAGAITDTGAGSKDGTSQAALFGGSIHKDKGEITLTWSTGLKDSSYWISKDGVFATISGKVASTAAEGTVADLKLVPVDRKADTENGGKNDSISCGYFTAEKVKVSYEVKTTNGAVKVPDGQSVLPQTLRGDADNDGQVMMNDVVLIMQSLSNPDRFGENGTEDSRIKAQGKSNADVAGDAAGATTKLDKGGDGVTSKDALRIQEWLIKKVATL